MYVWLVCFVVLFGLAELYPWMQGFALPFPVMLLAGVGLAIASNLDKWGSLPMPSSAHSPAPLPHVPPATAPLASVTASVADSASMSPPPKCPPLTTPAAADSISFTIRKSGADRQP